jgi:hypothetical protein
MVCATCAAAERERQQAENDLRAAYDRMPACTMLDIADLQARALAAERQGDEAEAVLNWALVRELAAPYDPATSAHV